MESIKGSKQKHAPKDKQFLKKGLLFCSGVILFDLLVWYLSQKELLAFINNFTSYIIAGLIRASGLRAIRDGNIIHLTNSSWIVSTECTAIFIMLIFASFVFVYPASMKQKGIALMAGIPFIFGTNVLRLYSMAWIDYLKPQYSELFHNYIWQVVFIVMVVFMWLVWIDKVVSNESKTAVSR